MTDDRVPASPLSERMAELMTADWEAMYEEAPDATPQDVIHACIAVMADVVVAFGAGKEGRKILLEHVSADLHDMAQYLADEMIARMDA